MKLKNVTAAFILCLAAAHPLQAQNYTIEITPDKKVVYVPGLKLPDYVCVNEVLEALPEFSMRGDELFSTFDIQYDGKSVGQSRDAVLLQTRISEIEKIEISTSSVSMQQNSTFSGTINLVPAKLDEGLSGEAFLDVATSPDVLPSANVNYSNRKLVLRGYAGLEGFWPYAEKRFRKTEESTITDGTESNSLKYVQETAKVNLEYNITGKDVIKGWFAESWQHQNMTSCTSFHKEIHDTPDDMSRALINNGADTVNSVSSSMVAHAKAEYKHTFDGGSALTVSGGYQGRPTFGEGSRIKDNNLDGEVKYAFPLFKSDINKLKIEVGVNSTWQKTDAKGNTSRTVYASPFAVMKYRGEKWSANIEARFQHYKREYSAQSYSDFNCNENEVVGNANLLWQMKPHHALRLTAARNIIRPTTDKLYPGLWYNEEKATWMKGNPSLRPNNLHTVELTYITDFSKNGNDFTFNASVGYIRSDDIIEEYRYESNDGSSYYLTYKNAGSSNLGTANLMMMYRYKVMTLTLSANIFTGRYFGEVSDRFSTFGNVSFCPIFNFSGDWMLSGKFMYNSPIVYENKVKGECIFAKVRFGKRIKRWTIHLEFSDIFDTMAEDVSRSPGQTTIYNYDLYSRYAAIGFSYKFGKVK